MEEPLRRQQMDRLHARFERLYGEGASTCVRRLKLLLASYEDRLCALPPAERWTEADNVLIAYGDTVHRPDEPPLATLGRFLSERLSDVIDTVHLLPFFPYSSDDGFSVIDYRVVNRDLGTWDHVHAIGNHFRLMFDLVLNHCSRRSGWFRDYAAGIAPQRYYFIEVERGTDLSRAVRPRQSPLLSRVQTRTGERWVWTTFSDDQVDLNFANPDVLLEFIDILLGYIHHGARIIRLDAIAYLWKEVGSPCIHLPQTHEAVKLLRDLVEMAAPHVLLLTETNVPHEENISYFGEGDEAHLVYNFSLPPLLLHALQSGTARHLTRWASRLAPPPDGCTFLNFTASHDGIGVRPLEGLLPRTQVRQLCEWVEELGGQVSRRANPDGSTSPYELNLTWFDAMGTPGEEEDIERQIERFLCSQTIMLALRGIPAIYFHSLTATRNDYEGVRRRGYARAINRHRWNAGRLEAVLADGSSVHSRVFNEYKRRLFIRGQQPALHPDGPQRVLKLSEPVFAIERTAPNGRQVILSASNVSDQPVTIKLRRADSPLAAGPCQDLLNPQEPPLEAGQIRLSPYQTRWLTVAAKDQEKNG